MKKMNAQMIMIRTYFGFTSALNPEKAAKQSFKMFQKVRIKKLRAREELFFDLARKFTIPFEKEDISCFEFGDPTGELVLLVHGWESNAGSMSKLAVALGKKGKRVIAFNLPGHADAKSNYTNLIECKDATLAVLEYINPKTRFSVISHSFGSAVISYALAHAEYQVDRLVFLTNPNKINEIFNEFKKIIGLNKKAYKKLVKLSEDKLGERLEVLNVQENLKKIDYNGLLLIHDKYDQALPYINSFQVNSEIEKAQLITLEKIGHYKMLWNDEVVNRAVGFVDGVEVLG